MVATSCAVMKMWNWSQEWWDCDENGFIETDFMWAVSIATKLHPSSQECRMVMTVHYIDANAGRTETWLLRLRSHYKTSDTHTVWDHVWKRLIWKKKSHFITFVLFKLSENNWIWGKKKKVKLGLLLPAVWERKNNFKKILKCNGCILIIIH